MPESAGPDRTAAVVDPVDLRSDAPPADTPVRTETVVDFDALGTGAAAEVPWYGDGALHYGDTSTPFDVELLDLTIGRVSDGYVVLAMPPDSDGAGMDEVLYRIPDGGEPIQLAAGPVKGFAVAPDGEQFAYTVGAAGWTSEEQALSMVSTITVVDSGTGDVIFDPQLPGPNSRPLQYISRHEILAEIGAGTVWRFEIWRPDSERSTYPDGFDVDVMSPAGELGVVGEAGSLEVFDVGTGEVLWSLPERELAPAFSPDGRYLVTTTDPRGGSMTRTIVIRDAQTGEVVQSIEVDSPSRPAWESESSIVFNAVDDGLRAALVRCTVDDGCELAIEPADLDDVPENFGTPFHLGR